MFVHNVTRLEFQTEFQRKVFEATLSNKQHNLKYIWLRWKIELKKIRTLRSPEQTENITLNKRLNGA